MGVNTSELRLATAAAAASASVEFHLDNYNCVCKGLKLNTLPPPFTPPLLPPVPARLRSVLHFHYGRAAAAPQQPGVP